MNIVLYATRPDYQLASEKLLKQCLESYSMPFELLCFDRLDLARFAQVNLSCSDLVILLEPCLNRELLSFLRQSTHQASLPIWILTQRIQQPRSVHHITLKPFSQFSRSNVMAALRALIHPPLTFVLPNYKIAFPNILYFEVNQHILTLVTYDQQLQFRCSLRALAASLPDEYFVRIHNAYLVNRRNIFAIRGDYVVLNNGKRLPIGIKYRQDLCAPRNQLLTYA